MSKIIKVGSDFSGVGAFNQSLQKLGIEYRELFACDMDKYARQTFIHNYGEPEYYPENVYNREIPSESLDIYMTSPPCQAFSLAGKRKGKNDERGILFFNSLEFIEKNKPRFFIFENVKGLLSDDNGNTFQEWLNYLGGKSVNGLPVLFPYDGSVDYHIYWSVLNAKNFGVPQNRERVFIVGIRDDQDNFFQWPREIPLKKKLKDVLENDVPEKYFLSEKMTEKLTFESKKSGEVANLNKGGKRGSVYSEETVSMTCLTATDYKQPKQILVKSATKSGCEIATENDSVCVPVLTPDRINKRQNGRRFKEDGEPSFTIKTQDRHGVYDGYRIRRLTPRECFRLMGFPDSFSWPVSDSQSYKQAGNSIVVDVLAAIIKQLKTI